MLQCPLTAVPNNRESGAQDWGLVGFWREEMKGTAREYDHDRSHLETLSHLPCTLLCSCTALSMAHHVKAFIR